MKFFNSSDSIVSLVSSFIIAMIILRFNIFNALTSLSILSSIFYKSLKVVNGEVDEKRAKTEYSIRKLDLSDKTIKLLQEYKKWQDDYIADKGDKWLGTNRIFTAINGKYIHPDTINDILQRIIKKYNLPKITFHELRHTYATILNDSGKNAKTIC